MKTHNSVSTAHTRRWVSLFAFQQDRPYPTELARAFIPESVRKLVQVAKFCGIYEPDQDYEYAG